MNPHPRCPACQSTQFWRKKVGGEIVCSTCHPPPAPDCVAEWIKAPAPPGTQEHSINPETRIWPISEWGPKCGRGFDEKELEREDSRKNRISPIAIPSRPNSDPSISVWTGKYKDYGWGQEEEYVSWDNYRKSIQPPPSPILKETNRLSATCGSTRVEIRKVDEEHWQLFTFSPAANKFIRRKDFNTFFREHAQRTAETWYGPAQEGWHIEGTEAPK